MLYGKNLNGYTILGINVTQLLKWFGIFIAVVLTTYIDAHG